MTTLESLQAFHNATIDSYKLANLPIIKFKPTFWQRLRTWLRIIFLTPL